MADDTKTTDTRRSWADASVNTPGFSVSRFQPEIQNTYVPATDGYANQKGMYISFLHVPSNSVVSFKAFITAYNENFISSWNSEEVYGRADPIHMFKNTQRKITLAFEIPAASQSEAFENLGRVQKLVQFLYPHYTTLAGGVFAQTISQSPLVRMKILNLGQRHDFITPKPPTQEEKNNAEHATLSGTNKGGEYDDITFKDSSNDITVELAEDASKEEGDAGKWYPAYTYKSMTDKTMSGEQDPNYGILGVIDNLTVNHNLETDDGAFEEGPQKILPKFLDVQISFSAIHEHVVGWQDDPASEGESKFSVGVFPYSIDVEGSLPKPKAGAEAAATGPINSNSGGTEDGNLIGDDLDVDIDAIGADPPKETNQALIDNGGGGGGDMFADWGDDLSDDPYSNRGTSGWGATEWTGEQAASPIQLVGLVDWGD